MGRSHAGRDGCFLEDKGWALALHARFAEETEAKQLLAAARHLATGITPGALSDLFRLLGRYKFLEIGPLAHKGRTVAYLLAQYPWSGALPLCLGDDDKDEEAFGIIQDQGGIASLVSASPRKTQADGRLESPRAARSWLRQELLLPARKASL